MMVRSTIGLAMIAALCLLSVAHAQTQAEPAKEVQLVTSVDVARSTSFTAPVGADFVVGWNYAHVLDCFSYFNTSNGYNYLVLYLKEGGTLSTNIVTDMIQLSPACQTGNWIAFYFPDPTSTWTYFKTYPYK